MTKMYSKCIQHLQRAIELQTDHTFQFGNQVAVVKDRHGKSMSYVYKQPGVPSSKNCKGYVNNGTVVELHWTAKLDGEVFARITYNGNKGYIKLGNLAVLPDAKPKEKKKSLTPPKIAKPSLHTSTAPKIAKPLGHTATLPKKAKLGEVKVVSYNLSFAAALQVAMGSEKEFVKKYCLNRSEGHCRENAMQSIKRMVAKPSAICFQEYIPWAPDLRKKKMHGLAFENVFFQIKDSDAVSPGLTMKNLFRSSAHVQGLWVAMHGAHFYEGIASVWDSNVMGHLQTHACVNLASTDHDVRPCLMTMMSTGVLIINCHAPQPNNYTMKSFKSKVEGGIKSMKVHTIGSIILCGDFNDRKWIFEDGVTLFGIKVHPPERLVTCCYDPGGGSKLPSGKYNFHGDYIMSSEHVAKTRIFNIDGKWQKTHAQKPSATKGRSDHEPITAEIQFS